MSDVFEAYLCRWGEDVEGLENGGLAGLACMAGRAKQVGEKPPN